MALNRRLTSAPDAAALLAIVETETAARFNVVNVCTALQRLARFHAASGQLAAPAPAASLTPLLARATETVGERNTEPRQVSGVLWACAKLRAGNAALPGDALAAAVAAAERAAASCAQRMAAQELSNSLWAIAKMGRVGHEGEGDAGAAAGMLAAAAGKALERPDAASEWAPQALSNTAWALGTIAGAERRVGKAAGVLATTLARAVEARVAELNAQEVANTLWAFGKLADAESSSAADSAAASDPPYAVPARALAAHAARSGLAFAPRQLASVAWGSAKLQAAALGELAPAVATAAPRLNAQEFAMCAHALGAAGAGAVDAAAVASLFRLAATRLEHFSAQQVAMVAAAAAKLGLSSPALVEAVGDAVASGGSADAFGSPLLADAEAVDLVQLCWAVAKLGEAGKVPRRLLAPLAAEASMRAETGAVGLRHAVTLLWSLATAAYREVGAVKALVTALAGLMTAEDADPSTRDLSDLAWALGSLRPQAEAAAPEALAKLLPALGSAAAARFHAFNSQELLKTLTAFQRAGGKHERLEAMAGEERALEFDFPPAEGDAGAKDLHVRLVAATPKASADGPDGASSERVDDSCGGTGRGSTGVALWQGSYFLAEWLSRQGRTPGRVAGGGEEKCELRKTLPRKGGWREEGATWEGRVGVEIGAGLGLPSIVAARRLGLKMVATDGDSATLDFLRRNAEANATADAALLDVAELRWGAKKPLNAIGLGDKPDVLLASDLVYGNDESKWRALVSTISKLSGRHTMVVLANMQRYPLGHPLGEDRFFSIALAEAGFEVSRMPQTSLHPQARGTGGSNSCALYVCRKGKKDKGNPASTPDGEEKGRPSKRQKRAPTEYNLFVKANTARVREANPGMKQTEIMAMLGAEYLAERKKVDMMI